MSFFIIQAIYSAVQMQVKFQDGVLSQSSELSKLS